jgi:hypothetical protein
MNIASSTQKKLQKGLQPYSFTLKDLGLKHQSQLYCQLIYCNIKWQSTSIKIDSLKEIQNKKLFKRTEKKISNLNDLEVKTFSFEQFSCEPSA